MSKTNAQVANASFQATILPSSVSPIQSQYPINLPLAFANATNVSVYTGSYSPSNDQLAPVTNPNSTTATIPATLAPNFLILVVDNPVNLTISCASGINLCTDLLVSRFLFMSLATANANLVTKILFDGQTTAAVPMAQGQAVNYQLFIGQATVS